MSKVVFGASLFIAALFASPAIAQPVPESGMLGIKINVADFARTAAFYGALGMQEGTRYNDHETALVWNEANGGPWIVMVKPEHAHFVKGGAFMVINVPDISTVSDHLKKAGFGDPGAPKITPRYRVLMLTDPDGNQIELLSGLGVK